MNSTQESSDKRAVSRWPDWIVPLLAAFVVLYILFTLLLSHLWGDQAFLLYAAREVVHGVQLDGPRLVETNPPMVVWFSILPSLLADTLHIPAALSLQLVILAILGGSTWWTFSVLRRGRVLPAAEPLLLAMVAGVVMLAIKPVLFGQKEQIMLALLMPYLTALACDVTDRVDSRDRFGMAERLAMGCAVGLGICFKPQHLLVLICSVGFLILWKRSLRPLISISLAAAVVTGVIYVGCVRGLSPYFTAVVPWLNDTYWALGQRTFAQLARKEGLTAVVGFIVLVVAWTTLRRRLAAPLFSGVFLAAAAGALAAFFQQHKGWGYQEFPASALLALSAVWILLDLAAGSYPLAWRGFHFRLIPWATAMVVAVALFGAIAWKTRRAATRPEEASIYTEMERLSAGTPVYAFSIEMSQFRVILERDLVWSSRFAHLWMLPALAQNEGVRVDLSKPFKQLTPERTRQIETELQAEMAEDFARTPPKVVLVEQCAAPRACDIYNGSMDFIAWFSRNPRFAAEWSHYRLVRSVKNFDVYERTDTGAGSNPPAS
jgi:hypothetical protein